MATNRDQSYTDEKGRKRWRGNNEIADQIKHLGKYLIICGYDESHAKQYGRVAYTISRFPESVIQLYQEGRFNKIRSLKELKKSLDEDKLQDIKGIGNKTLDTMRRYVSEHQSQAR